MIQYRKTRKKEGSEEDIDSRESYFYAGRLLSTQKYEIDTIMKIDLRSDTVTIPSKEMKMAMFEAHVGDDVFGDDPSVLALEDKAAKLFGHEAALFCPSGTMTNQIALKVHTNAPGEVICDELAHIYLYEGGGMAYNSSLSVRLLEGNRGRFTLEQLRDAINPDDIHFPPTQLVALENTCNKGGGSIWEMEEIEKISSFCKQKKLPLHLDGARIFNALVESKTTAAEMGQHFDSISLCLSKGLGAPVGSLLIASKPFIKQARRIRKLFGGGMRQAGYLAAAGIYALDHQVERLAEDHRRAREIATMLKEKSFVKAIREVATNIVIAELEEDYPAEQWLNELREKNILAAGMGPQLVRMVTHLDIDDNKMDYLAKTLQQL
jgi:threonine aldolase